MSYDTEGILRDKNNNPIPQYFNLATGKYEPLQGKEGANLVEVINNNEIVTKLDALETRLGQVLKVADADVKAELELMKSELIGIKDKISSDVNVTNFPALQNVKDSDVKTELELVKAELAAIKTKLDGTINTQLMGSYVEKGKIIIQHIDINILTQLNTAYFGQIIGSGTDRTIDFGGYSKRAIFIENKHEVSIQLDIFTVSNTNNTLGTHALFSLQEAYTSIPSGGTLLITEETNSKLKLPFRYCRLRLNNEGTQPTTGSVNFYVFGGNE